MVSCFKYQIMLQELKIVLKVTVVTSCTKKEQIWQPYFIFLLFKDYSFCKWEHIHTCQHQKLPDWEIFCVSIIIGPPDPCVNFPFP